MWKKIISVVLVLGMILSCAGCGDSSGSQNSLNSKISAEDAKNTEVLKIGEETIMLDYIYLYTIQFIYTYGVDEETLAADMDNYKAQILSQLRTDEIQYQYAKNNGIELTEDEKAEMDDVVERYYKTFPEEFLEQYGISKELVTELFYKQRYISKLTDETTKTLQEQYKKEAEKELEDTEFFDLYYLLFPTVEYKDGSPVTDEDGKYISLSDEEKAKQKELVEKAKERLESGEDAESLAEEYEIEDYSEELRSYKGAYAEDLENLIKDLQSDDVSEVYEDDLGYMVVKMINSNDEEYKEYYIETAATEKASEQLSTEKASWLKFVEVDEENDMIGDTWKNLDVSKIAKAMEKEGILSGK